MNRTTIPWPPEPSLGLAIKAIVGYMHIEDRLYDAKKKRLFNNRGGIAKNKSCLLSAESMVAVLALDALKK